MALKSMAEIPATDRCRSFLPWEPELRSWLDRTITNHRGGRSRHDREVLGVAVSILDRASQSIRSNIEQSKEASNV